MGLLDSISHQPNRDIFESHFNNGIGAYDLGKYAEAKVHLEYAAKFMEDFVRLTRDPEIRGLREENLNAIRAIIEDCRDKVANPPPETLVLPPRASGPAGPVPVAQTSPDDEVALDVSQFLFKGKRYPSMTSSVIRMLRSCWRT